MSQHQLKYISMPDRINEVITYYEFFKSALSPIELLTGVQDQMDLHSVRRYLVNGYHNNYMDSLADNRVNWPITHPCQTLWTILNELEQSCKHDHINPKP